MSGSVDDLRIRGAVMADHGMLEAVQRRASLSNPDDRPHLEAHPDAIDLPLAQIANGDVLVAEADGRIAGFAAIVGGELDGLFVEPGLWRRGIGAALVEAAMHVARRRGLTLKVIANPAALGFYERCGFTLEGEAQTRFGPAPRMTR